jgi:hypothetical protein
MSRAWSTDSVTTVSCTATRSGTSAPNPAAEIMQLIDGVDTADGLGTQMRSLSTRRLDEVEALLERTKAMKGWLEVAKECGCTSPAECALFPAPADNLQTPTRPSRSSGSRARTVAVRRRADSQTS